MKAPHKNVTLSLPEPLLRRFRVYAAVHNRSMSALMEQAIQAMMKQANEDRDSTRRRFMDRIRKMPASGIGNKIPWTRDEIYER